MTPRVRVLRIRPPYDPDCTHCLELLRAEADDHEHLPGDHDHPDWRTWFRTKAPPTSR
ncbi:hypothetical protein SEA_PYTHEAS_38 [Gordonia phage Pytheas]|nr:hypothetical protein SEA_JABLANSKI_38 [Gordonia Phage Jablanski]UYL88066.1 hypothetical protein SEA_PYTHEAS_38 [Gordonia phage Pytheas]